MTLFDDNFLMTIFDDNFLMKIFDYISGVREWQLNWQHVSVTAPVSLIQIFIQNVCNGRSYCW